MTRFHSLLSEHNEIVVNKGHGSALFLVVLVLEFLVLFVHLLSHSTIGRTLLILHLILSLLLAPLLAGSWGIWFDQITTEDTIESITKQVLVTQRLRLSQIASEFLLKLEFGIFHFVLESAGVLRLVNLTSFLLVLLFFLFLFSTLFLSFLVHLGFFSSLFDSHW